jgi:tetratricopeptide (TPR) repeat protein
LENAAWLERNAERKVNPVAFDHYLKAREKSQLMLTDEIINEALSNYQKAISLDPHLAEAYAGLARLYTQAAYMTFIPPLESYPNAKFMARKALELDPRSAEAVGAKADAAFYFDWDWEGPDQDYLRAIALNPHDPDTRNSYAQYLVHVGRFDEAIDQFQIVDEMTYSADSQLYSVGWANLYAGYPEKTLAMALDHRDMHPDDLMAFFSMAWAYSMLGQHENAVAASDSLEQLMALPAYTGFPSVIFWMRGKTYAEAGKHDKARAMIRSLEDLAAERYIDPWYVAQIHESLGDLDEAFSWLERAYEVHSVALVDLRRDLRHLADDTRYQDLAQRIGMPQE